MNPKQTKALVTAFFYKFSAFCFRLDAEKFDLINNTILPEAVHFWERTLMVRETKNTIRLNRPNINMQQKNREKKFFNDEFSSLFVVRLCKLDDILILTPSPNNVQL
ncbi:hypothetical protein KQX54_001994 [Cotesia glomerata]|uniref:Uncharacterized protein n=1 Tax=Cotesia glomerata TaxID=32391 RepID=A0AAV7IFD6_COTGL|nr:hypothetical protein KQX54_001994 [Cotesia glomerata]